MREPAVSVITVCRDHIGGLWRTHASLASQAWQDFEWLVQDGASRDGTVALLPDLCQPRPDWRSEPDAGPFDAMNRALARATGTHVLFLNAGDTLAAPETLAILGAAAGQVPAPDLVYGHAWEETAAGWRLKRARSHRLAWYGLFTHHPAIAYRRAAIAGLAYPARYRIAADYAFTLLALNRARHVRRLAVPLCRVEVPGLSAREAALGRAEQARIRREILALSGPAHGLVTAAQSVAFALRRRWPGLYARLRFGRRRPPEPGDSQADPPHGSGGPTPT